ncbi:MAG: VWA domain-containing protein [Candidatus Omnitrophica bacterium]|nr:VWA domain-containing protein [Candidatus Omnitrophota bacterium]MDE2008926.1 VWA domain-containing protein [Candidatus Omnitrophota bacterium]MDE2213511.1 VWA domain-containing protein [Candidatus Omnitrophota bacterium]MDE2230588.1 VWA domain-containing protein [Candidatus Omnitrophota bacterium]
MSVIVQRRILIALGISLSLHAGFLIWSYFAKMLPAVEFPEKPEMFFHVTIAKEEQMGTPKVKFATETLRKSPKPDNPFLENLISKPAIESEETVKNNIETSIQKGKQALIPSSVKQAQTLRKSDFNDIVTTRRVRRSLRENLVELGEVPTENFASGSPVLIAGEDISRNFLDKSSFPAKAALVTSRRSANMHNEFQMMKRSPTGQAPKSRLTDLGTALTYQLFRYQSPSGQKYFKLVVKVKDATINFPVIPKEIIFLVDASGSIGMPRLTQVEEGIAYSLHHLNPDDRFNILAFNNRSIPFSPVSLKVDAGNIRKAVDFLHSLQSWSTTDIYDALRTSVTLPHPFVPSYRVLISDGIPTAGLVNDRHVINEISRINHNKVSIFTFGGGAAVDPYMLDFIAFKNRGWSTVVGRQYFMGRDLAGLYDEIKDPLLLNVRYYVSGLNEREIFPRTMPDFFKGSQFVIYGKYTNEDQFAVQIRGDTADDNKEFIVSGSLKNAPLGGKDIARDWAFHKVYYLISELKYDQDNGALIDAIHKICGQFHIITPYSFSENEPSHPLAAPKVAFKESQKGKSHGR